jgi:hypothetical protein
MPGVLISDIDATRAASKRLNAILKAGRPDYRFTMAPLIPPAVPSGAAARAALENSMKRKRPSESIDDSLRKKHKASVGRLDGVVKSRALDAVMKARDAERQLKKGRQHFERTSEISDDVEPKDADLRAKQRQKDSSRGFDVGAEIESKIKTEMQRRRWQQDSERADVNSRTKAKSCREPIVISDDDEDTESESESESEKQHHEQKRDSERAEVQPKLKPKAPQQIIESSDSEESTMAKATAQVRMIARFEPKRSYGGGLSNIEKIIKARKDDERQKREEEVELKKKARQKRIAASKLPKNARLRGTFNPSIINVKPPTREVGRASKEVGLSIRPHNKDVKFSTKDTRPPKNGIQSTSLRTESLFEKSQTTIYVGDFVENGHTSSVPDEKSSSVLYRPTARAIFSKEQQAAKDEALEEAGIALEPERAGHFPFMKLAKETRKQIYELVVADSSCFIWPVDSMLARQQPDLAMVCRKIRQEVLPPYYAENRFAIKLPGVIADDEPNPKLVLLEKWLNAIGDRKNEEGKWLGKISHWVFDGALEPVAEQGQEDAEETNKTIESARPGPTMFGQSPLSKKFILDARYRLENEHGVSLRVHREAACILPQFSVSNMSCKAGRASESVRKLCSAWRGATALPTSVDRAKRLTRLAKKLNTLTPELAGACCKPVSGKKRSDKVKVKVTHQSTVPAAVVDSPEQTNCDAKK